MFIATLVAADGLKAGDISALCDTLGGTAGPVVDGVACDILFEHRHTGENCDPVTVGIDIIIQPKMLAETTDAMYENHCREPHGTSEMRAATTTLVVMTHTHKSDVNINVKYLIAVSTESLSMETDNGRVTR